MKELNDTMSFEKCEKVDHSDKDKIMQHVFGVRIPDSSKKQKLAWATPPEPPTQNYLGVAGSLQNINEIKSSESSINYSLSFNK